MSLPFCCRFVVVFAVAVMVAVVVFIGDGVAVTVLLPFCCC